uniref:Uncharacterized protein n=2 Tax=Caenorhabditis japonica TaxID=281687 RepID=A0A8R1DDF0_CAEJA
MDFFIIDVGFILYHSLTCLATVFALLICCKPPASTRCEVRPMTNSQRQSDVDQEEEEDSLYTLPLETQKDHTNPQWPSKTTNETDSEKTQRIKKKKKKKNKLKKGKKQKDASTDERTASTQLSTMSGKKATSLSVTQAMTLLTQSSSRGLKSAEDAKTASSISANSVVYPDSPAHYYNTKSPDIPRDPKNSNTSSKETSTEVSAGAGNVPKRIKSSAFF